MLEQEERLTPMKTVTDGVDIFINPKSKVTGTIFQPSSHPTPLNALLQVKLSRIAEVGTSSAPCPATDRKSVV